MVVIADLSRPSSQVRAGHPSALGIVVVRIKSPIVFGRCPPIFATDLAILIAVAVSGTVALLCESIEWPACFDEL